MFTLERMALIVIASSFLGLATSGQVLNGPAWSVESDQAHTFFTVGSAGDVNGDGYIDVVAGSGEGRSGLSSQWGRRMPPGPGAGRAIASHSL